MHHDDFYDLINRLALADRVETASDIILPFLRAWGLHNVVYAGLNMPSPNSSRPLLAVTYSAEWQKHYAQRGYVDIDSIVRSGLGGILPVDWSEIDRSVRSGREEILRRGAGARCRRQWHVHPDSRPSR